MTKAQIMGGASFKYLSQQSLTTRYEILEKNRGIFESNWEATIEFQPFTQIPQVNANQIPLSVQNGDTVMMAVITPKDSKAVEA